MSKFHLPIPAIGCVVTPRRILLQMATYGERLPLSIDDLSDAEDVELGDSPPIFSDPHPPPLGRLPPAPAPVSGLEERSALDDWADPATFGTTAPLTGPSSLPPPTPPAHANGAKTPEVTGE